MLRPSRAARRSLVLGIAALLSLGGVTACGDDGAGLPAACTFAQGDLVITEVYAEPDGADKAKEWIEVYNASGHEIDLRGLRIYLSYNEGGRTLKRHTIDGDRTVLLAPGAYGLLSNGPTVAGVLWGYDGLLPDIPGGGARIALRCDDGSLVDDVCFGTPCGDTTFEFPDARSWTYQSAGVPDYLANDEPERWQPTRSTPAAQNPPPCLCPQPPEGVVPTGVGPGAVHITELMPDPAGPDSGSEWVELYVQADGWVDLSGLRVTTNAEKASGGLVLSRATGCTLVPGGEYVLIAGDYAIWGPPPADTTEPPDGSTDVPDGSTDVPDAPVPAAALEDGCPRIAGAFVHQISAKVAPGNASSGSASLAVWSPEGELLDLVEYSKSEVKQNYAVQFVEDEDGEDGEMLSCLAGRPYETEWSTPWTLFGTPGAANPPCDACFCQDTDGGIVEGKSPAPGEIVLTEVMPDVLGSETDFSEREWFEARLGEDATGGRDLACLKLRYPIDGSALSFVNPKRECLHVAAGEYAVFARSDVSDRNGGLPRVHVLFPKSGSGLKGDNGSLGLYLSDGTVLDEIEDWGPSGDGVARQFDADLLEDDPLSENDAPGGWCDAFAPYGDEPGQYGSPGAPNFSCTACYCKDEDDEWALAPPPAAGELRITEVFGNTPGSEASELEWIEVRSLAASVRYLNCVALVLDGERQDTIGKLDPTCAPIAPGAHAVLCASETAAAAVGIPECYGYDGRALKNSDTVGVATREGSLDTRVYEGLEDGVSWMQSGDDSGTWCDTPADRCWFDCGAGDPFVGTPGSPNPVCAAP